MADANPPTDNPVLRSGESPLMAFISGAISPETQDARDATVQALEKLWFNVWVFEYTPASTEQLDLSYLRKVRDCDLLIWIVDSKVSEPVEREIHQAIHHHKPIVVIRLEGVNSDATTERLVKATGTKWHVASLSDIREVVGLSVTDDIIRAYRHRAAYRRLPDLEQLGRESQARCIVRWRATGVTRDEAVALLADEAVGRPPTGAAPTVDSPIKIIIAEMGAGKSLVGERLLQRAISTKLSDPDAPTPMWVDARDLLATTLQASAERGAGNSSDPWRTGVFLVVDDISQVGSGRARRILDEARQLVEVSPSQIALTSRPLPELDHAEEAVHLSRLPEASALRLLTTMAQRDVTTHGWPESVRDAIRRPLFAILAGLYLRERQRGFPRSPGDLIRHLVDRALPPATPGVETLLRRLGRLCTDREGRPIPIQEAGTRVDLQQAIDTGLLAQHGQLIAFGLPILTEWFAAQSLLEGEALPELASDPARLDAWRYPYVVALSDASFEQSCRLLEALLAHDPGFASEILTETIAVSASEDGTSTSLPAPREVGADLRRAAAGWVSTVRPLAHLLGFTRPDGSVLPVGIDVRDGWVLSAYYHGSDGPDVITDLPAGMSVLSFPPEWGPARCAGPPPEPAWPWRWGHQDVVDSLRPLIEARALIPSAGPLFEELLWRAALELVHWGSHRTDPIHLDQLSRALDALPQHGALRVGRRPIPLSALRERVDHLRASHLTTLSPPWPVADRAPTTGWIWDPYTPQRLLARTRAVYQGALDGYRQAVEEWFAPFARRLRTYATLPAQLQGSLTVREGSDLSSAPTIMWRLEPLNASETTSVRIDLDAPSGVWAADEAWRRETYSRLLAQRPAARRWLTPVVHHAALRVFGSDPATELAFGWLADDLKKVGLT